MGFGLFLVICGVAGFLSNPSAAKTALISGSTFGGLSFAWGALMKRGMQWARAAATVTTFVLLAAFIWRASVSWMAVVEGRPKLFAACLITTMGIASALSLGVLWSTRRQAATL